MLRAERLREHLKTITYKPGWLFRIIYEDDHLPLQLQVYAYLQNANAKQTVTCITKTISMSNETAEDLNAFDLLLYHTIQEIELHEIDEWFKINNRHYKSPHVEKDGHPYVRFTADYLL